MASGGCQSRPYLVWGSKPAPASTDPMIHPHTVSLNGLGRGLTSPSGNMRYSRPRDLHLREVGRFSFIRADGIH